MQAAAQIAALDANESWASSSQLQHFEFVSGVVQGTDRSTAQTPKKEQKREINQQQNHQNQS